MRGRIYIHLAFGTYKRLQSTPVQKDITVGLTLCKRLVQLQLNGNYALACTYEVIHQLYF